MAKVLSKGWKYAKHGGNFRKILKLEDFQLAKEGNVVVQMQAAPVGSLDLAQIRGTSNVRSVLPAIAGCTGVGVVAETDSRLFKSGDRVVLTSPSAGSWTTHQSLNDSRLIKVPESIPLEYASLLTVGPLAAYQILKASGLQKGQGCVVNGAGTLLGMSILQLAKHFGLNCVGTMASAPGVGELELEKLKQMGLNVQADPVDASVFGKEGAKLAINLAGGYSAAHLAAALGVDGKMLTLGTTGSDPHVFANSDLVDKNLTIQGFSIFKWLEAADRKDLDAAVAEISDLISSNKLKAFILRHELANALQAIDDAQAVPYNVVLMHEGTEKTWEDKGRDEYMKIDEKLQRNWESSAAAQEPYLKAGREAPWTLSQQLADSAFVSGLDVALKDKLAVVESEDQLVQVLESLSASEKRALGVPEVGAITMTPIQIKQTIAELEKLK